MKWIELLVELGPKVLDAIRNGLADDEIAELVADHLANAGEVGSKVIEAAKARRTKITDFKRGRPKA